MSSVQPQQAGGRVPHAVPWQVLTKGYVKELPGEVHRVSAAS